MLGLCLARRKKTKSTDNSETETAWRQLHNTPSGRKSRSKKLSSCPIFLYAHMWGEILLPLPIVVAISPSSHKKLCSWAVVDVQVVRHGYPGGEEDISV